MHELSIGLRRIKAAKERELRHAENNKGSSCESPNYVWLLGPSGLCLSATFGIHAEVIRVSFEDLELLGRDPLVVAEEKAFDELFRKSGALKTTDCGTSYLEQNGVIFPKNFGG